MDMGAVIALLLVLSTLTACSGGTVTDVKNALPALAAVPEETTVTYTVKVTEYADIIRDDDGTELVEYSYQIPVLLAVRSDGSQVLDAASPAEKAALEAVEVFNSRFSDWMEEGRLVELADYARSDRAWREEYGETWDESDMYTESLTCRVYATEHLVSVSALCDSYTGGAHPNQVLLSWNFDLTAGKFFSPAALATDSQEIGDLVTEEIIRQAEARAAEDGTAPEEFFWENYREIAADWGSYAVSFDETGMTVGYSPYEMACYAAGPQVFTLTYEQLLPGLSDHGKEVLELTDTVE